MTFFGERQHDIESSLIRGSLFYVTIIPIALNKINCIIYGAEKKSY